MNLTLKGTAISGDKKMAIIQKSYDKNKSESHMLKLGDEINGKKIIDIGRNFIIFDDGEYLYLQGGE